MDLWRTDYSNFFEAEGFPVSGVVDVDQVREDYARHSKRYQEWIQSGHQGEMGYLARGLERRLNPELVFPGLKSVISVLKPYSPHPVGAEALRYARYLDGPDYHDSLKHSLHRALESLKASARVPDHFDYKICVDTSAVLERSWAALCGLGWIGKNTLLIHPQLGSYVFIGVVFTNHSFGVIPEPMKDYCGSCTRCLSSCPTEALESHVLDARKCISYLTLEKRGPFENKSNMAGFVAGCDLCQEACPYNTKPVKYSDAKPHASHLVLDSDFLEKESENDYLKRVQGTALDRIRYSDFKRNLKARLPEPHK